MRLTQKQLAQAVENNILSATQAEELQAFLQHQHPQTPRFTFTHVLYYMGGLVAIGAMALLMHLSWDVLGGAGIVGIAAVYAAIGLWMTRYFNQRNWHVPAGICAAFVICVVPVAVFGLQQWLGVWPDGASFDVSNPMDLYYWHFLSIQLITLAVGLLLVWRLRYPFLMMPIAVVLSWTLNSVLVFFWAEIDESLMSVYSGLLLTLLAFIIDIRLRQKADYAFWLYIVGAVTFWFGLSFAFINMDRLGYVYAGINVLMILTGVALIRRVFVVLGALGCFAYLLTLSVNTFQDSLLFVVILHLVGLGFIFFGILWQKHEVAVATRLQRVLPESIRSLLQIRE